MSDDLCDAAERLLTFMHLCEEPEKHRLRVPLSTMDGAIPLAVTENHARSDGRHEFLIPYNSGAPAVWPIDVKTVHDANAGIKDPADHWPDGSMQFHRVRTITSKEARALGASHFSSHMLMDEVAVASPDGRASSARAPLARMGGAWRNAAPKAIVGPPPSYFDSVPIAVGMALAVRYEWTVWLGHGQGPRIRFLTDPLGAREVFRLRDLPPGRERRAALRHWVASHTRGKRDDSEARIWVRKHLRGAEDFTWNGMRCRVQPSDFDLEQMNAERTNAA